MKWRIAPIAAAFLVASTSVAAAQDATADPLFKLDGKTRAQVEALIDSAKQANLPWTEIRSKALEGNTKRFSGPEIVSAVRKYYGLLVKSREVLGPMGPTEIATGASVLAAGVRPEELALFRVGSGNRSPARPLVYLTDLLAKRGVPRDDAVAAFAKLWKDGAGDAEFDGLWHGIDQDILSGLAPKDALQSQLRRLPPRLNRPPSDQGKDKENPRS